MTKLTPGDYFTLEAVTGWLMLGNPTAALEELRQIPSDRAINPSVFLAVWDVHAHLKQWTDAAGAAEFVIALAPDWPDGYVKRAFALHELKRTKEAWQCLLPASRRFTSEWVIPYNLACYTCQLGRQDIAAKWFKRALKVGDKNRLKALALLDPDLEPLRPKIAKLAREARRTRKSESKIL
jgi:tetratricopeptide (TPR) repeat protein